MKGGKVERQTAVSTGLTLVGVITLQNSRARLGFKRSPRQSQVRVGSRHVNWFRNECETDRPSYSEMLQEGDT